MEKEKVDEKGLASRVEELEKVMRPLIDIAKMYRQYSYSPEAVNVLIAKAGNALAGAHAEEKPNEQI